MPTASSKCYRVRVFGGLEVLRPDGAPMRDIGRKPAALIAYLAVEGDGCGRADAAALLWPDKPESRARHNLRMALSQLRRAFGEDYERVFAEEGDRLRLRPEAIRSDAGALLAAARAGADDALADALAEARGAFLEGVKPPTKAFGAWAGAAAGRLDALRFDAESRLPGRLVARAARPVAARRRASRLVALAAGFVAVVAAAALAGAFLGGSETLDSLLGERGARPAPSISVLPFAFRGDDPEGGAFAAGLTEEVTTALATVSDILVVRPTSMLGDARPETLRAAATALNVRYLLTGEVTRDDGSLHVHAVLYDTEPPTREWGYDLERRWGAPFDLQADLARSILSQLDIELNSAEWNRIDLIADTDNVDAWLAAVDGLRHLIRVNRIDNARARLRYQASLRYDPDYVSALRGLAWTHFLDARLGWTEAPDDSVRKAAALVDAALSRAPEDGMAHCLLGALLLLRGDYDGAVAAGERAVELLPNGADASAILAHTLTYVGQPERAIALLRQAMRLSPNHPDWYRWSFGRALRLAGLRDAAVAELERGADRDEGVALVQLTELAAAYAAAGRLADARRVVARIRTLSPEFSATRWLNHPRMRDKAAQAAEFDLLVATGLPE